MGDKRYVKGCDSSPKAMTIGKMRFYGQQDAVNNNKNIKHKKNICYLHCLIFTISYGKNNKMHFENICFFH